MIPVLVIVLVLVIVGAGAAVALRGRGSSSSAVTSGTARPVAGSAPATEVAAEPAAAPPAPPVSAAVAPQPSVDSPVVPQAPVAQAPVTQAPVVQAEPLAAEPEPLAYEEAEAEPHTEPEPVAAEPAAAEPEPLPVAQQTSPESDAPVHFAPTMNLQELPTQAGPDDAGLPMPKRDRGATLPPPPPRPLVSGGSRSAGVTRDPSAIRSNMSALQAALARARSEDPAKSGPASPEA